MKTPHKCPVCNGSGLVRNGFYTALNPNQTYTAINTAPEQCRSCGGSGIIWEPCNEFFNT